MKYFILILLFVASLNATSQKSHSEILNMTKEIKIIDRLYVDLANLDKKEIDQATAYKLLKECMVTLVLYQATLNIMWLAK
jgi:hypothetical protein